MKKILTLFAFAVGGILCVNAGSKISGTDFEQFTLDENNTPATVIATDDSGKLPAAEGYAGTFWGPADYAGVADVVAKMSEDSTKVENKYLFVNTSGETLVRNISTDGSAQDLTTITDGKLFFNSKVQFTATESLSQQAVIGGTDKLIVWLKEETKDDITTTNLVVTAAQITSTDGGEVKDYVITNLEGFVPGQWYQLTIVAYPNAFSMANVPAFAVYVDGVRAEYDSTESAIATDAGVTVDDSCLWLGDGIFPSLQLNKTDNRQQITSVAFEGYGYVDNLEFSTDLPSFALPPAGLTIKWGEGIASITVNDGTKEVVITPGEGEYATVNTWKFGAGVYRISALLVDEYFNDSLPTGEADASSDNVVLDFSAQKIYCKIGDKNYASLEEALAYINDTNTVVPVGTKIVLYNDVNIASDGDPLTISKNIILDLAGKKITSATGKVLDIKANVKIISSSVGGEIVNSRGESRTYAVFVDDGYSAIIGDAQLEEYGVKITGPAFNLGANILLQRAQVSDTVQNEETGADQFKWLDYVDTSVSSVSAEAVDGYWVVAPTTTSYTVTFADGVEDAVIDVPAAQPVNPGEKAKEPTDTPEREGYAFLGWFLKTGDTIATDAYNFAAEVTGNIMLVAKWANSETSIDVPEEVTEEDVQIQIDETTGNTTVTIDSKPVAVIPPRYTAKFEDGKIVLKPQVPVIGATEADNDEEDIPAFDVNTEIEEENGTKVAAVAIGVTKAFKGLFYRISAAADLATLKGLGEGCTHTNYQEGNDQPLKLVIPKGDGTVRFFTVTVTDKKPASQAQ